MKVTLGKDGLGMTWQEEFPETTECCRCGGVARIGFVAHEAMGDDDYAPGRKEERKTPGYVVDMHDNEGPGGYWLHDCCAVAVYFCRDCLEPTALYNQA